MVLRRAAELNSRRWSRDDDGTPAVSPEVLVQVAAAAGIPERDVRRAMWDLASEKTAEPHTLAWKTYGPARLRAVREVERSQSKTQDHLESLLRLEQGLKLRRKTESSSLWDSGTCSAQCAGRWTSRATERCSRPSRSSSASRSSTRTGAMRT